GRGGDPLGRRPEGWSALPAGQTVVGAPERLWSGLALFVALITGSALMVRRFRQIRR
ncbi:type VII secretion-associated serine protease mycosin, partial [Micromonospora chalcea]